MQVCASWRALQKDGFLKLVDEKKRILLVFRKTAQKDKPLHNLRVLRRLIVDCGLAVVVLEENPMLRVRYAYPIVVPDLSAEHSLIRTADIIVNGE